MGTAPRDSGSPGTRAPGRCRVLPPMRSSHRHPRRHCTWLPRSCPARGLHLDSQPDGPRESKGTSFIRTLGATRPGRTRAGYRCWFGCAAWGRRSARLCENRPIRPCTRPRCRGIIHAGLPLAEVTVRRLILQTRLRPRHPFPPSRPSAAWSLQPLFTHSPHDARRTLGPRKMSLPSHVLLRGHVRREPRG